MSRETLLAMLAEHGQEHVLQFWDELSCDQQQRLESQIEDLDLDQLAGLVAGKGTETDFASLASRATPPPAVRSDGTGAAWSVAEAKQRGEAALRAGEVAAVLVAGGQGTRLGFEQPKGMFEIGPVSGRTLFQFFADRLIATGDAFGVPIPWYIMTSDATDTETREYFESNGNLGLSGDQIRIFKQGTMPAVDVSSGKLLLAEKGSLALSPDGHGGTVGALARHGCLDDAAARGIKHLAYFQVDNPLVALCDPTLIGHHLMAGSEMTTQVVRKRYPMEKVGNVVKVDGKVQIIEYSDLPEQAAAATDEQGEILLWAGNIAVHVIDLEFAQQMSRSADALPFHRANKKVAFVDPSGQTIEPDGPNAIKFERFIFDLLPSAENAFVVESLANEAFAPVKNANGAPADTPELAKRAIVDLHRSWLEAAGAQVESGVQVEINPRFSLSPEDLVGKIPPKLRITADRYFGP